MIVFGITVFNRKDIIKLTSRSLNNLAHGDFSKLIIDDASSDFDENFLHSLYTPNSRILRNIQNSGGADFNLYNLLLTFLSTKGQYIVVLDSDCLLRSDAVNLINKHIHSGLEFFSIFNTNAHHPISDRGELLEKKIVGAAGMVISRKIVQMIIDQVYKGPGFDIRICEFLSNEGIPILCLKDSLIQHIGIFEGQNSRPHQGDLGEGFWDKDPLNAYLFLEYLTKLEQKKNLAIYERKLWQRLSRLRKRSKHVFKNFFGQSKK
jgi:glycosyltransferase involved in cell wall biosynthesis